MPDTFLVRACVRLITFWGALAPSWRRDEWRNEWLAELHFRASRLEADTRLTLGAQLGLVARSAGAVPHLVWLWTHEWSLDMFVQDVRYGARMLRRRPLFTITGVATLALGIGATTAMFSMVRAVLLAPLPYPEPERLVKLYGVDARGDAPRIGNLSVPDVRDFARHTTSFAALGAHNYGGYFTVIVDDEAERVPRLLVSSGYFQVLGAAPALGRLFTGEEDRPSPPDVVVISDAFWRRRLGADPAVVGRPITIGSTSAVVVGVLPRDFHHPDPAIEATPEIFALLDPASGRGGRFVRAIARLRQGRTLDHAADELQAVAATLAREYPESNTGRSVTLRPLAAAVSGDLRLPLLLLQGATAAILLIVCANLANLLLAAGTGRTGELAVRTALGATRMRIVRQLLTESLLMASAGGLLGIALAWWTISAVPALHAIPAFHRRAIALDPAVLTFSVAVSMSAGLLFGLIPAMRVARTSSGMTIQDVPRHTSDPRGRRLRSVLVAAEIALSVALVVAAVLLVRSFSHLTHVDPGFDGRNVLTFQLALSSARHPEETLHLAYARFYERLRGLPGVDSVGAVSILPLSGTYSCDGVQIVGRIVPEGEEPCAEARSASPGYFDAIGIELVRGRLIDDRDTADAPHVVVINETMAGRFFPGEDAVGRRVIYSSRGQNDSREIVGVVRGVRHFGLDRDPVPEFYTPQPQPPSYRAMSVVVRARGEAASLLPSIRAAVREMDPYAPVYNVRTMEDLLTRSVADARLRTILLGGFAGVALVLALIGTYGVMSIAVSQRAREMGIRLALGARSRDIVTLVVGQSVVPIAAGILLGLAGGYTVGRAIAALLFDVTPGDPLTFTGAAAAIMVAGLAASWLPARRAGRVDPVAVLRA